MPQARPDHDFIGALQNVPDRERDDTIAAIKAKGDSAPALDRVMLEALLAIKNATPEDSQSESELSPERAATLSTLQANQTSKEAKLKTGIEWAEVEAKLRKSPEKLDVLTRLIARGGEPTVAARLSNGNFRFDELSAESPTGNRDVNFDQAEALATQLGAELMEPSVYDSFRGKIALDQGTWSWLRTSKQVRETGCAFVGGNGSSYKHDAFGHAQDTGLRCSLEV